LWTVANVASTQAAAVLGHDMMGVIIKYFRCGQVGHLDPVEIENPIS
jgi:hypothetical protein